MTISRIHPERTAVASTPIADMASGNGEASWPTAAGVAGHDNAAATAAQAPAVVPDAESVAVFE